MPGRLRVKQDIFTKKLGRDIFVKIWVMSTQMGHFYKKLGRRLLRQDIFTKKWADVRLNKTFLQKNGQTST